MLMVKSVDKQRFEAIADIRRDDYIFAKRNDPKAVKKYETQVESRRVIK
jgi:hypothetical protein